MDWFLYGIGLRRERVKIGWHLKDISALNILLLIITSLVSNLEFLAKTNLKLEFNHEKVLLLKTL